MKFSQAWREFGGGEGKEREGEDGKRDKGLEGSRKPGEKEGDRSLLSLCQGLLHEVSQRTTVHPQNPKQPPPGAV